MNDTALPEVFGVALSIGAALAGRAMAMGLQRPVIGWALLWEVPVVIGMGIIGSGAADWLDLHGSRAGALIAVMGYLGPTGVMPVLQMLARRGGTTP